MSKENGFVDVSTIEKCQELIAHQVVKIAELEEQLKNTTKQVRKEVLEKVYKVLEQAVPHDLCWSWAVIKKELDKLKD